MNLLLLQNNVIRNFSLKLLIFICFISRLLFLSLQLFWSDFYLLHIKILFVFILPFFYSHVDRLPIDRTPNLLFSFCQMSSSSSSSHKYMAVSVHLLFLSPSLSLPFFLVCSFFLLSHSYWIIKHFSDLLRIFATFEITTDLIMCARASMCGRLSAVVFIFALCVEPRAYPQLFMWHLMWVFYINFHWITFIWLNSNPNLMNDYDKNHSKMGGTEMDVLRCRKFVFFYYHSFQLFLFSVWNKVTLFFYRFIYWPWRKQKNVKLIVWICSYKTLMKSNSSTFQQSRVLRDIWITTGIFFNEGAAWICL